MCFVHRYILQEYILNISNFFLLFLNVLGSLQDKIHIFLQSAINDIFLIKSSQIYIIKLCSEVSLRITVSFNEITRNVSFTAVLLLLTLKDKHYVVHNRLWCKLGQTKSNQFTQTHGVPRGSVLGPLIFRFI